MKVLVINCGSSSLKYQLIDMANEKTLASGLVERIGIEGSNLAQKVEGTQKYIVETPIKDHNEAIKLVLDALINGDNGIIKSVNEIDAVGHRIVHGGEKYTKSVIITDEVVRDIEEYSKFAPLHNPAHIMGIKACQALMNVPMVAVFDTAFHQTMPEKAFLYGLPYELYKKNGIRKYGAHGTSHKYVSQKVAEVMGKDIKDLKIIPCHLGKGSSITAVKNGESVDTSMGFTPLEGLIMGTRSGSLDPAVVTYMIDELGYTSAEVNNILNKKSGVLGISEISSDFRDIIDARDNGNERAKLTLEMFAYRVKQYIASYTVVMEGVDVIVFTAGVGENSMVLREDLCANLEYMGVELDKERNRVFGEIAKISKDSSKVQLYVIPTNEELMIAKDTMQLIK